MEAVHDFAFSHFSGLRKLQKFRIYFGKYCKLQSFMYYTFCFRDASFILLHPFVSRAYLYVYMKCVSVESLLLPEQEKKNSFNGSFTNVLLLRKLSLQNSYASR